MFISWIHHVGEAHATSKIHRESVLVKPVNTPITPLCSKLSCLHPTKLDAIRWLFANFHKRV